MGVMGTFSFIKDWLLRKRRSISNWIWGYDYFISYHWRSGGKYAVALSQMLQERDFDCFLDRAEFVPGDDWKQEAARALENTQRLVVIATREAITDSDPVAHEVEIFTACGRRIIPICFQDFEEETVQDSPVMAKIKESVLQLFDSEEALENGKPNPKEIVDRLITTDKVLRRRRLRLRIVSGVVIVLVVALIVVGAFGYSADQARQAEEIARTSAVNEALNAEERAQEANVQSEKAIAAQNFAEYFRVSQRAIAEGVDADEKRALEAIAPKYLQQSHDHLTRATQFKNALDAWRSQHDRGMVTPNKTFTLEIIPARYSGALLLYFGDPANPNLMLVDGGDRIGYRKQVRPVLQRLAGKSKQEPLQLDLVISSQVDIWQLGGLSEMMIEQVELSESEDEQPWLSFNALWANAFLPFHDDGTLPFAKDSKIDFLIAARKLRIPINQPFTQWVAVPEAGAARVQWSSELEITVLAPKLESVGDFAKFWTRRYVDLAQRGRLPFSTAINVPDSVETFTDSRIELLTSPIIPADVSGTLGEDQSIPNLASIVLMLELAGKRILLASDTTDKVLVETLGQAGFIDADDTCSVDVLILPHDGSDRNVSEKFFSTVMADHYVALGDGGHGNPELQTFQWLLGARRGIAKPFTIYLTRHPTEFLNRDKDYPVEQLFALFQEERDKGTQFRVLHPKEDGASFAVNLLVSPKRIPRTLVELQLK